MFEIPGPKGMDEFGEEAAQQCLEEASQQGFEEEASQQCFEEDASQQGFQEEAARDCEGVPGQPCQPSLRDEVERLPGMEGGEE